MNDPFEDGRESLRRLELRDQGRRERNFVLLRHIWEALPPDQQSQVEEGLKNLILVQQLLTEESGGLLTALNVSTTCDHADAVMDVDGMHPIYVEVGHRTRDVKVSPEEYLCAIACWRAGEEYTTEYVTTENGLRKRLRHPRWPESPKSDVSYVFTPTSTPEG